MAGEKIFDDEYFEKLDKIAKFTIVKDWDKLHRIRDAGDAYIHVYSSSNPNLNPETFLFPEEFISAKNAVKLIKTKIYGLEYGNNAGIVKNPERVAAMWLLKEAVGRPYIKHWTELVSFYKDKKLTQPLSYEGNGEFKNDFYTEPGTRDWNYKMANALLGLEEHNQVLLDFFWTKDEIIDTCETFNIPVPVYVQKM